MMRRSYINAIRVAILLPLLLTGCADHTADIEVVRSTRVRSIEGNGERDPGQLAMMLGEYLQREFKNAEAKIDWSDSDLPSAEGAAEMIGVNATIRSGHPLFPEEVVLQFGYEPPTQKVVFLGAEIDGEPATTSKGSPVKLSGVFKAVLTEVLGRTEAVVNAMGGDASTNPMIAEFRQAIEDAE